MYNECETSCSICESSCEAEKFRSKGVVKCSCTNCERGFRYIDSLTCRKFTERSAKVRVDTGCIRIKLLFQRARVRPLHHLPIPTQWHLLTPLGNKPFENTVGKGEIARNEQFLLFPQCFLPVWITCCYFRRIWNCHLQALSVWKSLKFVVW